MHIQFGTFKGFTPPPADSLLSLKFVRHLAKNIFPLGIHAAKKNIKHQSRIYELEQEQVSLLRRASDLEEKWREIEQRLNKMIEELWVVRPEKEADIEELQKKLEQLLVEQKQLDEEPEELTGPSSIRITLMALAVLRQFSSDITSLGFQGYYQNHLLKHRIKVLQAQNTHLERQIAAFKRESENFLEHNIDALKDGLRSKREILGIRETDQAKAYFEAGKAKEEMQKEKDQRTDLQKQLEGLQVQYQAAKEAEQKLEELRRTYDWGLEKAQLEAQQRELNRSQMNQEFENVRKRIGPLLPKYKLEEKEKENLEKAKRVEGEDFISDYKKHYENIKLAPQFFIAGFSHALMQLFKLAKEGKVRLNSSLGTPVSRGAQAVYHFLALEWIRGGTFVPTCQGYSELHLNNEGIKLVPSLPENVLKYQEVNGKLVPVMTLHFQARDDFTPGEDVLKHTSAACGIDPVTAKYLWWSLSDTEQKYFCGLLLEPAREDDHPDHVAVLNFIGKQPKKKQEQIYILRDLISDIGAALETKFRQDLALGEWQKYLDTDNLELQPFIKKEEVKPVKASIEFVDHGPLIPWQIDCHVISDIQEGVAQQADFLELILNAQEKYQTCFANLKIDLLKSPMKVGTVIQNVTWEHLNQQYYRTHQLISPHGCLLSNLLATLMVEKQDLIPENIEKLKIAMAAYLDHPNHAKEFESAIRNDFKCTMSSFKKWLRGENSKLDGVYLSDTILEIAAYTLGVKIVLFSLPQNSRDKARTQGKVDSLGRLMPVEDLLLTHHFGPPTEEMLLMAVENNYSFYGLFPKLKLKGVNYRQLGISLNNFKVIEELTEYWRSIKEKF